MSKLLPSWVSDALRCPVTHARLELVHDGGDEHYRTVGVTPARLYPVRNSIPILLESESTVDS